MLSCWLKPRAHVWRVACLLILAIAPAAARAAETSPIRPERFARHVAKFNTMEPENVVNAVPNAQAQAWLEANVPWFECSDEAVEEIYWFRWWALRKHLLRDKGTGRWVFTEFITRARPVSSALGHHLMEGRWLRTQEYHDDYVLYWLRGAGGPQEHLYRFSQWLQYALWQRVWVTQDHRQLAALFDELVADYRHWENTNGRADGLFWNYDVRDAMEESISGGRKVKNVRPTISVYMYGNALALADIARCLGRTAEATEFAAKAAHLRPLAEKTLWNEDLVFFGSSTEQLEPIAVREEIGFIPWYFSLPEKGRGYERAWAQLKDEQGFKAPYGITTAERRHPKFRSHGTGTCEWDGAVWPYATSQTLTALANVLRDYPQDVVGKADYYDAFLTYTKSHQYDGLPYLGEYQDETTGAWLKGRDPRSYYYNHSTYADLLITGVVGLRPRPDEVLEVDPLLPSGTWDWFCLDKVKYRGHELTIFWDRDGSRYGKGAGLRVFSAGKLLAESPQLARVTAKLP